eukprot:m.175547 g.175547  ORF g.175547 m.175547 type:complete len:52 (+) comp24412_c0_seq2:811-966(+)
MSVAPTPNRCLRAIQVPLGREKCFAAVLECGLRLERWSLTGEPLQGAQERG